MEMTMLEYQLRREGYFRRQKEKWYRTREIAYASLVAGGLDTKKLSKEQFIPIDSGAKPGVSNAAREAYENAMQQYQIETNGSRT